MSIARLGQWIIAGSVGFLLLACGASFEQRSPKAATALAVDFAKPDFESGVNGRLETHEGLRVLRLWGTSKERGYAHGFLMAKDIVTIMNQEFAARFADSPQLLLQARAALPRLIEYPDEYAVEIDAMWRGLLDRGVHRHMQMLGREFDQTDLLVANALDVFGLMGCSSFTVWGDQAVGGGVLTARNFDWPLTGEHMLDHTMLIVQGQADKRWTAAVAWPGYVGAVTGISADGVAAYLHVGSARPALPQPSSWPSAVAVRKILQATEQGAARLRVAEEMLEYTSPPIGFLTNVVLPSSLEGGGPVALFETNVRNTMRRAYGQGPCVVTNHFRTRVDGRHPSPDSTKREDQLIKGIDTCFQSEDRQVDIDEAWQILASVERGGGHSFGTLHSLVFRHEPWCFELRVATHGSDGVIAAPSSRRRYWLTRAQVFGAP